MELEAETISVNGVEYVKKGSEHIPAKDLNGMKYVIVRTYSAGVFAGYLERREGKEAVIRKSRNIWYWDGACGLSQLAVDGTKKPENCKFTVVVDRREVTEVIEILDCTEKAQKSIQGVKKWEK